MPDQRISELIEKTTLADTDLMPMVDIEATPDETKKITGANVKAQVLAGHKDLTTGVHGVGASIVCSEAIADSKITTHKGDASAHHTKTTSASEITSGRFGMPRMPDGTSGLVLTAQGTGADPVYAAGGGGGSKIQDADGNTSWDVEQTANEDKVHGKVKGVEAFLLQDDGILDLAQQSRARAYLNSEIGRAHV